MSTISIETVGHEIQRLKLLRGFPADSVDAMKALMELLQNWCIGATGAFYTDATCTAMRFEKLSPEAQLHRVIDVALERCAGWVGPVQLREILDELYPLSQGKRSF
jgi:hypothetical protein